MQHEAAAKRAEMDAYTQQARAQNIEAEASEARKTLEAQTQHERHRAEYRDELERKRQVDMLQAQKYMQEEQLKKQEEMVARQEAMRRKTAEHEAELRTRTELAKVQAESEGKIRQERANHDLILEKVRLEAGERRDTVLKAIADGGKLLGEGLASYLNDKDKLRNTALTIFGQDVHFHCRALCGSQTWQALVGEGNVATVGRSVGQAARVVDTAIAGSGDQGTRCPKGDCPGRESRRSVAQDCCQYSQYKKESSPLSAFVASW
jgi:Domain of unknown function (DUF3523)